MPFRACYDALLDFIRAQNPKKVPLPRIQELDEAWIEAKDEHLVRATTTGPCADRLKQIADAAGYGEVLLMDDHGALVCANAKTTDYWQGDEEKWIRAFNGGKGATCVDRPRPDESTKTNLAHISVPVMDANRVVGVITVGIPAQHHAATK